MSVPFDVCPNTSCMRRLVYKPPIKGVMFTMRKGVIPIHCPSVYCNGQFGEECPSISPADLEKGCKTRFFHNYSVTRAGSAGSVRQYYSEQVPSCIEVSDHIFVDEDFCVWVRSELALNRYGGQPLCATYLASCLTPLPSSSASATGILNVYQLSIGSSTLSASQGFFMNPTIVLDCFFLYALLCDSKRRGIGLELPHQGEQASRLLNALDRRNQESAGTGLLHWDHSCDECHPLLKSELTGEER